jgi:deoxyribodipyrimidine photo-lyase
MSCILRITLIPWPLEANKEKSFRSFMIQEGRITQLNSQVPQAGRYILYWMQASQRTHYNHALEYAVIKANELGKPLLVYFGITAHYLNANERHYYFMLEGLNETRVELKKRGIQLLVCRESPEKGVVEMSKNACLVVTDRGYTRVQKNWRGYAARNMKCPLVQLETDVIVPVEIASNKEEYAAATIRNKINCHLPDYLKSVEQEKLKHASLNLTIERESIDISDVKGAIQRLPIQRGVRPVEFCGGTSQAKKKLKAFIRSKLPQYHELKNHPGMSYVSDMSPYLHFGHISPLYIAEEVVKNESAPKDAKDAYLEELIIRRELSMNFVYYNPDYDNIRCLPGWAINTLQQHQQDEREHIYTLAEFEQAQTHDPYWNAAQLEMVATGKMHGYMRMYWGKKIIEWSKRIEDAYQIAIYLNDKYELDGRDPNGYAGIAWCFGKHDRPWKERNIFGKVRYMNDRGLKRKFNMDIYVKKVIQITKTQNVQL